MNRVQAIERVNKELAMIDEVLEIGDVNQEQFHELTKLYTAGMILKAQLQASQTMRQRKNQYRANNVRGDE